MIPRKYRPPLHDWAHHKTFYGMGCTRLDSCLLIATLFCYANVQTTRWSIYHAYLSDSAWHERPNKIVECFLQSACIIIDRNRSTFGNDEVPENDEMNDPGSLISPVRIIFVKMIQESSRQTWFVCGLSAHACLQDHLTLVKACWLSSSIPPPARSALM